MLGNTIATMSGRQISFFMVEADERAFIDFLCDRWGASFHKRYSAQREPSCVPLPLPRPSGDASVHTLLIRIAGLEQGWVAKAMATTDGVERYACLVPTNAAIEFSRSWQNDDRILVRGRLYLPLTEMKDRLPASDCLRLERAADSIWRWVRSRSTKLAGHWAWVFPGAAEALEAGTAEAQR